MKEMRTMVSPPPDFANHMMERIQAYKRARAKRSAVVTLGVLAIALFGLFALASLQLALDLEEIVSLPSAIVSLIVGATSFSEQAFTLINALWLSVTTIASSVNSLLLVAYACAVVGLTVVWLRVAFGPFQYSLKLSWRIEQ